MGKAYAQLPMWWDEDEVRRHVDFDDIEMGHRGNIILYSRVAVGGVDEEGIYEYILDDGPAQGERIYVHYFED